jgi:predicted MFS family arabinose efflux permease
MTSKRQAAGSDITAAYLNKTTRMFWGVMVAGGLVRLCNGVGSIAYPWAALEIAGPAFAGLVAFAVLAPMVVGGLFGGILVESFGVRKVAITSSLMSAVSALGIAILALIGQLTMVSFVLLVLAGSLLDGPALTANQARWPEIARLARVPLLRANAFDAGLDHVVILAGPSVASLTIWLGGWEAGLAAMAVVGAFALLATVAAMPGFRPRRGRAASMTALLEGARFIWHTPLLRVILLIGLAATAVFILLESVVVPSLIKADGQSPAVLTLYLVAAGFGALAGAGLSTRLFRMPQLSTMLGVALALMAIAVGLMAACRSPLAMIISGGLLGLAFGPLGPVIDTLFQTLPPKRLRAQVLALAMSIELAGAPFATVAAGYALEQVGGVAVIVISAGLLACLALVSVTLPVLRRPPRRR